MPRAHYISFADGAVLIDDEVAADLLAELKELLTIKPTEGIA